MYIWREPSSHPISAIQKYSIPIVPHNLETIFLQQLLTRYTLNLAKRWKCKTVQKKKIIEHHYASEIFWISKKERWNFCPLQDVRRNPFKVKKVLHKELLWGWKCRNDAVIELSYIRLAITKTTFEININNATIQKFKRKGREQTSSGFTCRLLGTSHWDKEHTISTYLNITMI